MPSSHGSGNSNSSQTAKKERAEFVQQAHQPGVLPDEQEGGSVSDNAPDTNDGEATERLGKYADYFTNEKQAKKYMKHLDKERAQHGELYITENSIIEYVAENDPEGFSGYCEMSKYATPHSATPGGVWSVASFTAAQSKRTSKKPRKSRAHTDIPTVDDKTQEGAPSTAAGTPGN